MLKSMLIAGAGGFVGTCLRYLLIGLLIGLSEKAGLLSGNTFLALSEVAKTLRECGVDVEKPARHGASRKGRNHQD